MEQLELKHLAPYLPFKLLLMDFYDGRNQRELVGLNFSSHESIIIKCEPLNKRQIHEIKPILRPLSDLVINHSFNPEWLFIFEEYIDDYYPTEMDIVYEMTSDNDAENFHYPIVQRLFENHFDVFGLIEKGLAININTLGK